MIEELSNDNAYEYAYVNSKTWLESYKGIVDEEFLELINTPEKIKIFEDKLKEHLLNKDGLYYLLRVNNKPVGVMNVRKPKVEGFDDCMELGALYLLNEVKGKGYGKILFNKAKEEIKKLGYSKMVNGCLEKNPSNDFYIHMGGIFIKRVPHIIKGTNQELFENIYLYENI